MNELERIRSVIAGTLGAPLDSVQAATKAGDLKGWDALHQFQIVTALEEEFGIRFSAQELSELDSVEKIRCAIELRRVPAGTQAAATPEIVVEVLETLRPGCEFAGVDDFFARGVLDSLDLTLLVSALEERLDIGINALDIIPQNFRNVDVIMALVAKYPVVA